MGFFSVHIFCDKKLNALLTPSPIKTKLERVCVWGGSLVIFTVSQFNLYLRLFVAAVRLVGRGVRHQYCIASHIQTYPPRSRAHSSWIPKDGRD